MEDLNGLASSLAAGVSDVRGCLILSRDGLVLGAHPPDREDEVKPAWMRFAAVGDPERGFAQFGMETWCYVRRGPYSAFALVGPGARPGLVLDQMDQALLVAEQARSSAVSPGSEPEVTSTVAPSGKPRTSLHPERPVEVPVVMGDQGTRATGDPERVPTPAEGSTDVPDEDPGTTPAPDPWGASRDPEELDRLSLTKELGRLLQEDRDGADG